MRLKNTRCGANVEGQHKKEQNTKFKKQGGQINQNAPEMRELLHETVH